MRLRHIRNDEGFMCFRINAITAESFRPNWASMASNAVRSSQAISTMREMQDSESTETRDEVADDGTKDVVGVAMEFISRF